MNLTRSSVKSAGSLDGWPRLWAWWWAFTIITSLTRGLPSRSRWVKTRAPADAVRGAVGVSPVGSSQAAAATSSTTRRGRNALESVMVRFLSCSAAGGCPDADPRIGIGAGGKDHGLGELDDERQGVDAGEEVDSRVAEARGLRLRADLGERSLHRPAIRDDAEKLLEVDEEGILPQAGKELDTRGTAQNRVDRPGDCRRQREQGTLAAGAFGRGRT